MSVLKFTKKSICIFIFTLSFLLAQLGVIFCSTKLVKPVYAAYQPEPVTSLSNADFGDDEDSNSFPQSPSSWVSATGSSSNSSVKAGVIPTSNEGFIQHKKDINLKDNPFRDGDDSEKAVLMIQAKNGPTKYGYRNSSPVPLDKNSFYKVVVWVRTLEGCDGASLYTNLTDSLDEKSNFIGFTTEQNFWNSYTFFIQTKTYESASLELELWLGSKEDASNGTALFDDIYIEKVTHAQYYADGVKAYTGNNSTVRVVDLKSANVVDYSTESTPTANIENGDFEDYTSGTLTGYKLSNYSTTEKNASAIVAPIDTIVSKLSNDGHIDSTANTDIANNLMYSNKEDGHALVISNKERAVMACESTTNFTIAQHQYYKISVYAKTGNLSNGGATITLTQRLTDEEIESGKVAYTASIKDIDTKSNNLPQYNGFQEYSFYVYGNPYRDVELYITFSLGTVDGETKNMVSGFAIFDDVTMELINEKTYTDNSSSTNAKALNCHNESNTSTILNGAFNFTANVNEVATYPLAPKNWTSSETDDSESGIINVNKTHFENNSEKYGLTTNENPGPATTYPGAEKDVNKSVNNVLMIRNKKAAGAVTFKSDTFSLATSTSSTPSIIKVVVYVKTLGNAYASVSLQNNDGVELVSLNKIQSKTVWTPYTLYLKGSCSTQTICLALSTDTAGYAFFDYVSYSTVTIGTDGTSEEEIKSTISDTVAYSDLFIDSFDNCGKEISTNLYTPTTFVKDGELPVGSYFGIVNTTYNPYNSKVRTRTTETNDNALMISNTAPLAFTAKSALTYSLTSGSYYKISVWVHTSDITSEEEVENIGATIELRLKTPETDEEGVEIKNTNIFTGIITDTEENNGWVEYAFYINAEAGKEVNLYLGLGLEDALTQGYVFFDGVSVVDITEDAFTKATEDTDNEFIKTYTFEAATEDTDPENKEDEEDTSTSNNANYWLIIPSVILGVAIIVAIFGYVFKKMPLRRYGKRKFIDKEYDRKTISEENVRKELKAQRDEKLAEIDQKIAAIEKQIAEDKKRYEGLISKEDNTDKRDKLVTTYAKERARNQKLLDNLNTAKTFILDPANIKLEENKEIKKRKRILEEENKQKQKELHKKLNQTQEDVEKEKKVEPKKKSKK